VLQVRERSGATTTKARRQSRDERRVKHCREFKHLFVHVCSWPRWPMAQWTMPKRKPYGASPEHGCRPCQCQCVVCCAYSTLTCVLCIFTCGLCVRDRACVHRCVCTCRVVARIRPLTEAEEGSGHGVALSCLDDLKTIHIDQQHGNDGKRVAQSYSLDAIIPPDASQVCDLLYSCTGDCACMCL
jgi:hypothetical protein